MTTRGSELSEVRGDEAIRAHCLRVATWSSELAGAIGLSESDRNLVEQAAIAHHVPEILVDDQARRRLLAEMHLEAEGERPFISDRRASRAGDAVGAASDRRSRHGEDRGCARN